MESLTLINIQLLLEYINDSLGLGIRNCKNFKVLNGKIHIPLSTIHLATPEAVERLHLQHIFPFGEFLSVSIQDCIVSIPIFKLVTFVRVRESYHSDNDRIKWKELQKMFSSPPSLEEICLNQISDYLEDGCISKQAASILSNFQLSYGLTNLGIFKNKSPSFRLANEELSKRDDLVDKTSIDPYHPWAIVPYVTTRP